MPFSNRDRMFSPRSPSHVVGGLKVKAHNSLSPSSWQHLMPRIKEKFEATSLPLYDESMDESTTSACTLEPIHPPISSPVTPGSRRRRPSSFFMEHRPDEKLPLYNCCTGDSSSNDRDRNRRRVERRSNSCDELEVSSKHRRRSSRRSRSAGRRRSNRSTGATADSKTTSAAAAAAASLVDVRTRRYLIRLFATGHLLQVLLLIVIALLVYHSHSRANFTATTLRRLQQEESLSLLQLQKIERQSLQLHENIRGRLHRAGVLEEHEQDPLEPQHHQLEVMTSELNSQVNALQRRIQLAAREQIVQAYGEGPVKVVIELDFNNGRQSEGADADDELDEEAQALQAQREAFATANTHGRPHPLAQKGSYISILLWPDSPHAAWAWLEQIGRGLWEGANLEWDSSSTLLQVAPARSDPLQRGQLEFVEYHESSEETSDLDTNHEAWTVGLREIKVPSKSVNTDNRGGKKKAAATETRLEMFINLADNRVANKHETCIGKILNGFDALQRLLEATRLTEEGQAVTAVRVKKVSAMHITHRELEQIY